MLLMRADHRLRMCALQPAQRQDLKQTDGTICLRLTYPHNPDQQPQFSCFTNRSSSRRDSGADRAGALVHSALAGVS